MIFIFFPFFPCFFRNETTTHLSRNYGDKNSIHQCQATLSFSHPRTWFGPQSESSLHHFPTPSSEIKQLMILTALLELYTRCFSKKKKTIQGEKKNHTRKKKCRWSFKDSEDVVTIVVLFWNNFGKERIDRCCFIRGESNNHSRVSVLLKRKFLGNIKRRSCSHPKKSSHLLRYRANWRMFHLLTMEWWRWKQCFLSCVGGGNSARKSN